MSPPEVTRWLAFFDKLVDAVVATQDSCREMAVRVRGVIDGNRAEIAAAQMAHDRGKKLPRHAQRHMLDGVRKMATGIDNCADDKRVEAAFAGLGPASR